MCLLEDDFKQLFVKMHDDAERFTGIYSSLIDRLTATATSFEEMKFIWQHLNTSHTKAKHFAEIIL